MNGARIVIACGLLVLLAGFGVGTERTLSADRAATAYDCGSAIPGWALVTGTRAAGDGPGTVGTEQRAAAAACAPVLRRARAEVAAVMLLGSAVALAGLAATQRTPGRPRTSSTPVATSHTTHSA